LVLHSPGCPNETEDVAEEEQETPEPKEDG